MADTEIPSPDTSRFETITLSDPIKRGEQVIAQVTLRKPRAGEMRGLTLQAGD